MKNMIYKKNFNLLNTFFCGLFSIQFIHWIQRGTKKLIIWRHDQSDANITTPL